MIRVLPDLKGAADVLASRGGEIGRPLHVLAETTSTNDEAKRAAKEGAPHGSTWLTESQLGGRGRQGRAWLSSPGESLLFSVLLRLECVPVRLPLVALVAGLAVRDAVARAAPLADVRIKWPNDVVVRDRGGLSKIAGVLVETSMSGRMAEAVVVGIGINVHTRVFPPEIAARASSVALVASRPPERMEILADVLEGMDRDVAAVVARGLGLIHARLAAADALAGRAVKSEQGEGVADSIDLEGRLVVRAADGKVSRWSAGEVHLA